MYLAKYTKYFHNPYKFHIVKRFIMNSDMKLYTGENQLNLFV